MSDHLRRFAAEDIATLRAQLAEAQASVAYLTEWRAAATQRADALERVAEAAREVLNAHANCGDAKTVLYAMHARLVALEAALSAAEPKESK
jgi:hypothetical protein